MRVPKLLLQLLPRHQLPGARHKLRQKLEWLFLKTDFKSRSCAGRGFKIDFIDSALDNPRGTGAGTFLFHNGGLLLSLGGWTTPTVAASAPLKHHSSQPIKPERRFSQPGPPPAAPRRPLRRLRLGLPPPAPAAEQGWEAELLLLGRLRAAVVGPIEPLVVGVIRPRAMDHRLGRLLSRR
jgi:hypothetical protein